jgi:hypothetical protein
VARKEVVAPFTTTDVTASPIDDNELSIGALSHPYDTL